MEKLPTSEKENMLPVVLLAPWLNSIKFENTYHVIDKSIGNIPIIVDLDRSYESNSLKESRLFFWSMVNGGDGYKIWIEVIKNHDNYIPVVQLDNVNDVGVEHQIENFRSLGRGFVFRINISGQLDYERVINFIKICSKDDVLVVLDYGYTYGGVEVMPAINAFVRRLVDISPAIKFVISGSNFPNDFQDFDNFSANEVIDSRRIYNDLLDSFGNYQMFYGDWASTKPRSYDGHGNTPRPRIDFPTKDRWIFSRSKDSDWDFQTAASKLTLLPEWQERPQIWGTGMIEKTAAGDAGGIYTNPAVIAARINIHLYLQNNYSRPTGGVAPEGVWVDPI